MFRIGTSGWRYAGWRGDFYPVGLRQRDELDYAASRFTGLEINGSFYSLQRPTSYARWHAETPDGFCFAVKGGRFITHMRRLRDVESALGNFFGSGVLALGAKLGPVLWQLPASFGFDAGTIEGFLRLLPRTHAQVAAVAAGHDAKLKPDRRDLEVRPGLADRPVQHALEVRHPSFADPAFADLLARSGVACVLADNAGRWPTLDRDTADFSYLRLHGDTELYTSGYSPQALDEWAAICRDRSAGGRDVHVYFDNDAAGHAPHDAAALLDRLAPPGRRAGQAGQPSSDR